MLGYCRSKQSINLNDSGAERDYCNLTSPSYLEWDALSVFMECVIKTVMSQNSVEKSTVPVHRGLELLRAVLAYNTQVYEVCFCLRD